MMSERFFEGAVVRRRVIRIVLLCLLALFPSFRAGASGQVNQKQTASAGKTKITVTGSVKDSKGEPLAGAYIVVKGTKEGTSTDLDGNFTISFVKPQKGTAVLVFSFIGMESVERSVSSNTTVNVSLKEDGQLDEVVVNGFYSQPKETFTGSATTISGEQLVEMSPTNLLAGISAMTPGMVIVENNAAGSNPNAVPSILIRGANSLITNENEEGVNNPLIVLDGVEITMEELYDLDIFDIERIDVLKDASATILYGEKGSNGVIVVERKRTGNEKVKLTYNFLPRFSYPDLSSFNLCTPEQKLELERLAGLYDTNDGSLDEAYAYKLQKIRQGVNDDWLHAPLRIPFSYNSSLSLSSRGEKLDFRANATLNDTYGVMKGDNRSSKGLNFTIGYHLRDKLTLSFKTTFSMTDTKDSPYGSYSKYSTMNPYEPIYDDEGNYIKVYYFDPVNQSGTSDTNPLYEATLSSFKKSRTQSLKNSLSGRWNVSKSFYVTGQGNVGLTWGSSDSYESPDMVKYSNTDPVQRGKYSFSNRNGVNYSGKLVANYGRSLDTKGSMFRISGGSNIQYSRSTSSAGVGIGFLKDNLSDLSFALSYPSGSPSGTDNIATEVGFFANANAGLWNRYVIDASYRSSGSSRFGSANSFAPFWALGAGWNIHNEPFVKKLRWVNTLTLRYSVGYTGNVAFDYYQAKTVYQYKSSNRYYTGIGALPKQMGNPDLKWQRTLNNNIGLTGAFFDSRLNVSLDFYSNTTYDMLMSVNLPPSVGTTSMKVNFGEINNKGLDLSLSAQIIRKKDLFWSLTLTGGHVMDQIRHISDSLKNTEVSDADDSSKPKILFKEGGSQYAIYAMRSAGIDPATGREIFIKRNGDYTFKYDSDERVAVGNTNPALRGSLMTTLRWKGLSFSMSTTYTFGSDYYNTTLQGKVEDIDKYHNVDARAFTDRWKNPGDLSRYLDIKSTEMAHYSERFVEKRNEVYFSSVQVLYDVPPKMISRFGLKKLAVGFGLSDLGYLSTIRFERGTSYPYCRSVNLTFRPTF